MVSCAALLRLAGGLAARICRRRHPDDTIEDFEWVDELVHRALGPRPRHAAATRAGLAIVEAQRRRESDLQRGQRRLVQKSGMLRQDLVYRYTVRFLHRELLSQAGSVDTSEPPATQATMARFDAR